MIVCTKNKSEIISTWSTHLWLNCVLTITFGDWQKGSSRHFAVPNTNCMYQDIWRVRGIMFHNVVATRSCILILYKRNVAVHYSVHCTRISTMRTVLKFWSINMEILCKIYSVHQKKMIYCRESSGHLHYTVTNLFLCIVTINTHFPYIYVDIICHVYIQVGRTYRTYIFSKWLRTRYILL